MKKKEKRNLSKRMMVIVCLLVLIEMFSLFLMNKSAQSKILALDDVNPVLKPKQERAFAILLQSGNSYENAEEFPDNGYVYDDIKSGCIDENGEKLLINGENILEYDSVNKLAYINTGSTSYCYLYFNQE